MSKEFPVYIDELIEDAVARLNNLQGPETFNFAFMTDTHNCTRLVDRLLYSIREIDRRVPIAFTCLGGDYLCNNVNTTKDEALRQLGELKDLMDEYSRRPPVMVALGNHDNNPFGPKEQHLKPEEIYNTIMSHHAGMFVENPEEREGMYGYYDDPVNKVRAIYINPMNAPEGYERRTWEAKEGMVIGDRQLNWLANVALRVPNRDWAVVLFGHFMPLPAPHHYGDVTFGGDAFWEILAACKYGTAYSGMARRGKLEYDVKCDFSDCGPTEIIGYFCGHYHYDWSWKVFGIPVVACLCACSDNFGIEESWDGTMHRKTRGSGEESAASIFTVDRKRRCISCVRCGAGPDFSVSF